LSPSGTTCQETPNLSLHHPQTLSAPPSQTIYFPEAVAADASDNQTENTMALVVKTSVEPTTLITPIQKVIRELDPTLPTLNVLSMSSIVRASTARLSFIILILGAAALVTLILGVVGLYGVMAYVVTLRTKELGVRIALGAQPSSVAAMMTRQGLTLTVAGLVAGLALFAGVSRFLGSFLYDTARTDPVALGGASLTLVVVGALATFVPARRAARVDPVETLRAD
jgi:putative ABC transport system permease protein